MKVIVLILLCITTNFKLSISTNIDCKYRDGSFIVVGRIYQCSVDNDPLITTQESAQNVSIQGDHQRTKEDKDVLGFYAARKTIQYFPNGLQKFINLKSMQIINCLLKELHQSDLKSFADLVLIYMENNAIEVLEEGLFAYNHNLKVIGFAQNKIVHIDPQVFDHLTQLSDFLFNGVPCIDSTIYSSVEKVKNAVKTAKTKCVSSSFVSLIEKTKELESQVESLSSEDLKIKLKNLEENLPNSKFLSFRPLSDIIQKLKNLNGISNGTFELTSDPMVPKISEKTKTCPKIDAQLTENINDHLSNITSSVNNFEVTQKSLQNSHKLFEDSTKTSMNEINKELKTTQESIQSLRDEVKETISDTIATISDVKINQNEIQASLTKIKTTQNDMKVSMNDLRTLMMKNENYDGNFSGKLENFEDKFENFETKVSERFDKLERSLTNIGHKMSINLDEKIKRIEKVLMKRIEELLHENLSIILKEKLKEVMNGRFKD